VRFLIVTADYPQFLHWLYDAFPGLHKESFQTQAQVRAESHFAEGGCYSSHLRELGHEAHDIYVNNEHMQNRWARDHAIRRSDWRFRRGIVPWVSSAKDQSWFPKVLKAQIKHYRPDILLNQAMDGGIGSGFWKEMKPYVRLLVGQHAAPLWGEQDFSAYDLVLSAGTNFVDYFRQQGVRAELVRLAFNTAVLEKLGRSQPSIQASFIGNVFPSIHDSRHRWLDSLCQALPVEVWTPTVDSLPADSAIVRCRQGSAWGMEMYKILNQSRITLNCHLNASGDYAGNLRLYEATGVGTLLVTDWKPNLHEIFLAGKEVVAYRSTEECVELISYYLGHEDKRADIARAGQQRTLRDHNYERRTQEFLDTVRHYI
jgi:spore maturation protein CgeB